MQKAGGVGRVQDCSDVNVTLGAGVDGYSITYDHASGKFVLSSVSGVGISKIQDADDVNVSLGAGVDEYALCYDHGTTSFVLRQISGIYVALTSPVAGQNIAGGLNIVPLDNVSSSGIVITQGLTTGIADWQTLFAIYNKTPSLQMIIKARGSDGALVMQIPSVNTTPALDSYGIRVMSSGNAAQVLQAKAILFETAFSSDISGAVGGTVYGGKDAGDSLKLESTFNATKGYVLINSVGGNCGIGNSAPGTPLDINYPSAVTNTVSNVLTVRHSSSGTPAAGFGVALIFALESTTTENQRAGRVYAVWSEATHATRKAQVVFTAYDTAEREGIRIGANGSAATIGFLGATPSAQLAHVADVKGDYAAGNLDSEAEVISMANSLAAAINSLNALVETFGLRASS